MTYAKGIFTDSGNTAFDYESLGNRPIMDDRLFARLRFLMHQNGYANQSMCRMGDDTLFCATFNSASGGLPLTAIVQVKTDYYGRAYASFAAQSTALDLGHGNSLAWADNVGYVCNGTAHETEIKRFSTAGNRLTAMSSVTLTGGTVAWNVMSGGGSVYVYGRYQGSAPCIWALNTAAGTPSGIVCTLSGTPDETPRTEQDWAMDDNYLYRVFSNPNTVGVYRLETGVFLRWLEVGDYMRDDFMLGEIETVVPLSDGTLLLSSQYYYPNGTHHELRYWAVCKIGLPTDMPSVQNHAYPNAARDILVADKVTVITDPSTGLQRPVGDLSQTQLNALGETARQTLTTVSTEGRYQDGSVNYPYHCVETAIYAAMATPQANCTVIVNSSGAYTVEELVLRIPQSLSIRCLSALTVNELRLSNGTLMLAGASVGFISTAPRSHLIAHGCTFTGDTVDDNGEEVPAYQISGEITLVNGIYTGDGSKQAFQFNAGAHGVVGFTDGTPQSNNFQQLNLTLYGVKNEGQRHQWMTVFDGGTAPTVGAAIGTTQNLIDGVTCRIRWSCPAGDNFTAVVHVNGNTLAELSASSGDGTAWSVYTAHLSFKPSTGKIRVEDIGAFTVDGGFSGSKATSGALPAGWSIQSIDIMGH